MAEAVTVVLPEGLDGERLDRVVAFVASVPRTQAAVAVDEGRVRVGGRVITGRSHRVRAGETVTVEADPDAPLEEDSDHAEPDPSVPVDVVHADEHVIVVDKPAGLVVHPGAGNLTGTLVQGLLARFPALAGVGDARRPGVVHRLDKGTSGLLVVAHSPVAYSSLVAQLAARTVERRYTALVWGTVEADAGIIDAPIGRASSDRTRMAISAGGREARTAYEVQQRFAVPETTLVECRLETGRTHQVRVHLAAIGHPLVGDSRYRGGRKALDVGRPFLHARALAFDHPASGQRLAFESDLPADLLDILTKIGRSSAE